MKHIFHRTSLLFCAALLLPLSALPAFTAAAGQDYFYLQEKQSSPYRNSCAQIFADIRSGKEADVGGVIRLLKNINVDYRLRDYDNAIMPKTRQVYVDYDELLKEVAANKQEIYCKIELAQYMRDKAEFSGPIYDQLLATAFDKLAETYAKASSSLNSGDFERAIYTFDLIAPYADAYKMFLLAEDRKREASGALALQVSEAERASNVAGSPENAPATGAISRAAEAAETMTPAEIAEPGAIAMAAQSGAITAAAEQSGQP